MAEERRLKSLRARDISKYSSLMERRLWRDWLWRRRWTRHSRSSMNRYLRRHYHLTSHQARLVLDNMTKRNIVKPVTRRGKQYWVSTTVEAAENILNKLETEKAINKRKLIGEEPYSLSQINRALQRLTEKGIILETIARCPTVRGASPKPMRVYSLEKPSRAAINRLRREIREKIPESERIYGETVEEWLRREYGPDATIEKEWQIPGLGPENKFDFLVTTPDGTRIPVEIKGWRYEPITQESARVAQFKWKMSAIGAERGLFFAPYAQPGLPTQMEEEGIRFIPLKFPEEER